MTVQTKAKERNQVGGAAVSEDILEQWLNNQTTGVGRHALSILTEKDRARDGVVDELRQIVRGHYVAPEVTAKRLAALGARQTAALLRDHLPTSKTARSGDLSQMLA